MITNLSILHPPFLLGLITGGAVIYWFTGASTQAVSTGAYRAVEFIKKNIKLEGATKASVEDSKRVVAICTQYAQKGMFNIFLGVFFATLAFAFYESYFFIGYLVAIAIAGLYQAIFMANAGGAWDNAKKFIESFGRIKAGDYVNDASVREKVPAEIRDAILAKAKELVASGQPDKYVYGKGSEDHKATVVGDTVGDPFKDTSGPSLNILIKLISIVSVVFAGLIVKFGPLVGEFLGLT